MRTRSIKFRAWHVGQKKYFSSEVLGEDQLTLSVDGRGFVNVHSGDSRLSEFYPEMIPEQFTGLADCDGKEIYEGDIVEIVRWKGTENEARIRGDIFFDKGMFRIQNGYGIAGTDLIGQFKSDIVKVIGNVHESLDLLAPYSRSVYECR